MPTFGEQQHPSVLFRGFDADDPRYLAMSRLVPTSRLMPANGWEGIRPADWDIVVSRAQELDSYARMHVLAFGCTRLETILAREGSVSVYYRGGQPSQKMTVPDDLPRPLRRLITSELIPYLQALPERPYLKYRLGTEPTLRTMHELITGRPLGWQPFVLDPEENIIAGAFERGRDRWCWTLPYVPEHPELWFAAALEDWHEKTPQMVPLIPGWTSREEWMTQDEIAIRADLDELEMERTRIAEKLNTRELELRSAQSAASSVADSGLRRLLTAQGDALVQATIDALQKLGYEVENVDQTVDPGIAKVEDLRLRDMDDPSWTNITEVKGHAGGAKVNDLHQLGRFAELFVLRTGESPRSRWYVVNQFVQSDPDTRRAPLVGADEDVTFFAEIGGLVIDTRELFQLTRAVKDGRIGPADARRLLRTAMGVFKFDSHRDNGRS